MSKPFFSDFPAGLKLLDEVTADETTSAVVACNNFVQISGTVRWDGTVGSGQVIFEGAPDVDDDDAWQEIFAFDGASDSTEAATFPGPFAFVRARVNTAVAGGGNVTAYLQGLVDM